MPESVKYRQSKQQQELFAQEHPRAKSTPISIADLIRQQEANSKPLSARIIDQESLNNAEATLLFEDNKRFGKYLESLLSSGVERQLITVSHESVEAVAELSNSFPNFSDVVQFITDHMKLCLMSRPAYFRFPPIALGGPPGIGKTEFCRQLAAAVGIDTEFHSCSSSNAEWAICGLERGYSTAHPGKLAEFYRRSKCANPLFIMDEFEKPSAVPKSNNASVNFHGPFYTLLEPSTAKEFEDNYYEVKFDASYINWIMTVNAFNELPEPIQSRLTHFEIAEPDIDERIAVCHSIYRQLHHRFYTERRIRFSRLLDDGVARILALTNPREIRKAMEQAMMKAVSDQYSDQKVELDTFGNSFEVRPDHISGLGESIKAENRGIGFMAKL